MNNLIPGKSTSSVFNFCRCFWFFRWENFTITVLLFLLIRWQDSMSSGEILQPNLSKIFNPSSSTSPLTSQGMPKMPRHSRLEYCAFAKHCRFKVTNLLHNKVLTFFVIDSSELNVVIVSGKLRSSSGTLLLASSNLLCRDKTIGIRSCLLSLSSESLRSVWCHNQRKSYRLKS